MEWGKAASGGHMPPVRAVHSKDEDEEPLQQR